MTTTLIVLAVIIGSVLILAVLMGNEMKIERKININKPAKQIFDYVRLTKNHDNFSTWNMLDPEMKKEYRGTDGQEGFVYIWESTKNKNVGAGEQETIKLEQDKSIEYEIRFSKPMKNIAKARFGFTAVGTGQTEVIWGFYSPSKFPMSLFKPIFQNLLGKDLEKGLKNLKSVLENS